MKAVLIAIAILVFNAHAFSQGKPDSIQFKHKGQAIIELKSLSDGDHTFTSDKNKNKMILTVKDHRIVDQRFVNGQGTVIGKKSLDDLKNGMEKRCTICTTIRYPDGHVEQICSKAVCPSAQGINDSL